MTTSNPSSEPAELVEIDELGTSDRGLARERTELAWNRSGLAVLVAVGIMVRHLHPFDDAADVVVGCLIAAGALLWGTGMWFARQTKASRSSPTLGQSTCLLIMIGTLVLAVAASIIGAVATS